MPNVTFRYIAPATNEIGTIHAHFVGVRIDENDANHEDVLRLQAAISDENSKILNVADGVGATFGLCTIPHDVAPSFTKTKPKVLKDFAPVYEAFVGLLQPGTQLAAECKRLKRSDLIDEEPLEDAADEADIDEEAEAISGEDGFGEEEVGDAIFGEDAFGEEVEKNADVMDGMGPLSENDKQEIPGGGKKSRFGPAMQKRTGTGRRSSCSVEDSMGRDVA